MMPGESITRFRPTLPATAAPFEDPNPPPDWWRYLVAVRRFKWLVLGVTPQQYRDARRRERLRTELKRRKPAS